MTMARALLWLGLLAAGVMRWGAGCGQHDGSGQQVTSLIGAGATLPYPLYAKWAHAYYRDTQVRVNYQSIGSGGGIQQIKAGTVDFGATDAPLKPEQVKQAGLVQFPTVVGGVVPVVNLQGMRSGSIALDGETLAGVFLGDIDRWNDPRIRALNPRVDLPDKPITVIHRADGSGTTWIFTHYLSAVSRAWAGRVGTGQAVSWPKGAGGKGNEGVAVYVQRVDGAIGYVEYAYAIENKLPMVAMKNAAGHVVEPGAESFQAAAASADWENAPEFYVVLTNQPGDNAWPIAGATFVLVPRHFEDRAKAEAILKFFDYGFQHDRMTEQLHYVPLPASVKQAVHKMWATTITANGQPVWPPKG